MNFLISGGVKPSPAMEHQLPDPPTRNIFTTTATTTVQPFVWTEPDYSGTEDAIDPINEPNPSARYSITCRGDQSGEIKNGGPFRSRLNTVLGDVVNSSPLYSKAADFAYHLGAAGSHVLPVSSTQGFNTYRAYVANKKATRNEVVVFGANDGMLHVLDATGRAAHQRAGIVRFCAARGVPELERTYAASLLAPVLR